MTAATAPTGKLPVDEELVTRLAGRVTAGPRAERVATTSPFSEAPLAELPVSDEAALDAAFATARAAQVAWARRPVAERARLLLRYHDVVLDRQAELLDLMQLETGKARKHAFEEIADVALVCRYYGRTAASLLAPQRRLGIYPGLTRTTELHHPKGVVGVIAPWNYPLTLAISDALPALVAGNAVVLKPDTQTALTALRAAELLTEAGMPEALLQVVVGDGPVVGPAVVDRADYVCFTGSTRTGRTVAERAARRLVGCSLELGGKNPMLVLDDADVDRAAQGAVRACFSNAGQLCISIERLYVDAAVHDAFVDRFVRHVRAMRLGSALDFTADMGSLTSRRQLEAVIDHVEDARAKGAQVLAGGRPRPDVGPLFYEPTVLAGVRDDMALCEQETFGPVVSVYRVDGEDEAVRRANDTAYGLNASVWTRDHERGARVAGRIHAGTVNVNEGYGSAWGSMGAPMGGMKDSGLGRRHGAEGLLKYTEAQTIAVQRGIGFEAPGGVTYEQWARVFTTALRAMKSLGVR